MMVQEFVVTNLIKKQEGKGGFNFSLLSDGTKLFIQTQKSIYTIVWNGNKSVTISGGTLSDGKMRFVSPVHGRVHGCTWGGTAIMSDWLGEDMSLEFSVDGLTYVTSKIQNVIIESSNGSWNYSLEWKKG